MAANTIKEVDIKMIYFHIFTHCPFIYTAFYSLYHKINVRHTMS